MLSCAAQKRALAPTLFFFLFPISSGSWVTCVISALFFLAAEKPSVVQERACIRRPWLVSRNWCLQGPLLKWGPRSTPARRGGWLTMVVPRPSASRATVNVVPSAMEMCSLSLNLHNTHHTHTLGVNMYRAVYRKVFMINNFSEFHEWSKFAKISITNFICI